MWEHLMPELVRLIIGYTNDRDFWSARKSHRMFRLDHTTAEMERRVARKWVRVSPERACRCGRADVLSFLYDKRRVQRTFSPLKIIAEKGDEAMLALVVARSETRIYGSDEILPGCHLDMAIDHGHCSVLLGMCRLYEGAPARALYYALRKGRLDIAQSVYKALDMRPHELATASAKTDHVETLEAAMRDDPSISLAGVAHAAATAGSLDILRHLIATHCGDVDWNGALIAAIGSVQLEVARLLVHSRSIAKSLDLGAALAKAAGTHQRDDFVDLLLDTADLKSLDCTPAIDAAVSKGLNGPIYAMHKRGVPVDLQQIFDHHVAHPYGDAVKDMCLNVPWLNRQTAIVTTAHPMIVEFIVSADRNAIDFDAAITARTLSFKSGDLANERILAYLKQERDRLPTVPLPPDLEERQKESAA